MKTKFKVWDNKANGWLKHPFIDSSGNVYADCDPTGVDMSGKIRIYPKQNCIIVFFTGIVNKDGKEIYEGDVVKFKTISGYDYIEEVIFEDGAFMPFFDGRFIQDEQGDWFNQEEVEIVGNIYDNPELLKNER